jgi:Prokaryotic Cytochrome C oxidase subunit IV
MRGLPESTVALLALLAITLAGFTSAEAVPLSLVASAGALAAGLVKVDIVVTRFMHLRWRHAPFRQVLLAWLLLVAAILLGGLSALPWP